MIRLLDHWAIDRQLVGGIIGLSVFGIVMIYSAGQVHVPNVVTERAWVRQIQWFMFALVAFSVL